MNPSTEILAITLGGDDAPDPSLGGDDASVLPSDNRGTHSDVLTVGDIYARAKNEQKQVIPGGYPISFHSYAMFRFVTFRSFRSAFLLCFRSLLLCLS